MQTENKFISILMEILLWFSVLTLPAGLVFAHRFPFGNIRFAYLSLLLLGLVLVVKKGKAVFELRIEKKYLAALMVIGLMSALSSLVNHQTRNGIVWFFWFLFNLFGTWVIYATLQFLRYDLKKVSSLLAGQAYVSFRREYTYVGCLPKQGRR